MSVIELPSTASAHAYAWSSNTLQRTRVRLENGLVRYDGWFLVFTAVILGLGATIISGMAIWCVVKQKKNFTGEWGFKNFGLKVRFECE
ncbi:hypothetical protein [Aeromicrobium sp. Leaf350]|uniref:hypothetical protein n=1 Tax=Aeromicrobium sp. Leaf350 TaxID=2876565 RepID=UPI001E3154C5|nr:hypothetical protein [Aeromicrobium sp. Leaf350]